jgi:hypothetical protein
MIPATPPLTVRIDDGIVVEGIRVGWERSFEMAVAPMPRALVERLGNDGAQGLVTWLASERTAWSDDVLNMALERFDRRLTTEISGLRIDVARELSALRVDVARDMSTLRGDVARDLSAVRSELLKWSFLFWVGQVATMAALLAFMLRP